MFLKQRKASTDPRLRSLLQKAARRGYPRVAELVARRLYDNGDRTWLRSRSVVITFEECWPLAQRLALSKDPETKFAAIREVAPALRTQTEDTTHTPDAEEESFEPEIVRVFDELYDVVRNRRTLDQPFVDRLNQTNIALKDRIDAEVKRMTVAQRASPGHLANWVSCQNLVRVHPWKWCRARPLFLPVGFL